MDSSFGSVYLWNSLESLLDRSRKTKNISNRDPFATTCIATPVPYLPVSSMQSDSVLKVPSFLEIPSR